ncbi:MAG TPA: ATP-binding cassette domain-containing protein [Pseudonocardiaceae bacterium]|nr:ATP-binding cassette domain-containing protein [Pseudonocardiaceae bacterium]
MGRDVGAEVLQAEKIAKRFTDTLALDGVDFEVRAGEVHVLIGENGAGKSTLVKIITGVYSPDAGTIRIHGCPVRLASPQRARELGIAVIYQELTVVPELSVAENLFLARQPRRFGFIDWARIRRESVGLLERVGLHVNPTTPVRELGIGQRQLVEIVRAVDLDAKVLILDEPTAALTGTETDQLLKIIADLRQQGVGLVLITTACRNADTSPTGSPCCATAAASVCCLPARASRR